MSRITLAEMAEACEERAIIIAAATRPEHEVGPEIVEMKKREKDTFAAAAHVLRILATFEDRSRTFVAALLKEWRSE